jgi:TrwC relaxase
MTSTSITAPGLSGVLRMTWVHDDLAHVLEHAETDEPSGTWTGLACRDHELPLGGDVDNVTLRHLAADGKIADLVWEAPEELAAEHGQAFQAAMEAYHKGDSEAAEQQWQQLQAIWSQAWAANYAALDLLQDAGITTFSPVKPQRWVVASFEHHCGRHGLPHPHVHNIVITSLTTGVHVKLM